MSNKFYCIVAGSRTFSDYAEMCIKLDRILSHYYDIVIVSGGARGADALAERYARKHGCELVVMPADWNRFGKAAGYKRNEAMHQYISQFEHRGCVCFWDGTSHGTQHNFKLAKQYDTPLRVVRF